MDQASEPLAVDEEHCGQPSFQVVLVIMNPLASAGHTGGRARPWVGKIAEERRAAHSVFLLGNPWTEGRRATVPGATDSQKRLK